MEVILLNKNIERERKIPIQIYLSEDEKKLLDYKMKKYGFKSKSRFIRELVTYGFVYNVDYSFLHETNVQLSKIGTNINQIAHRVNVTGNISDNDLNYLKKELKDIWQLLKSTLSQEPLLNR